MYSVSESYRAKMLDQVQTHRLIGTIDNVSFSEADVIGVSYQNQCSQKNVLVGSVNIGVLKFTLLRDLLNRGDYYQKKIVIKDGLLLGHDENDEPIWEDVPVGEFYISEALWTGAGIDITAYDVLSKMDEPLNVDQTSGKIYSFCRFIEEKTGAGFGMTEQECDALPNGTEIISPYEENDIQTYRDLLSALAQMVGGFGYAAKDGTFKLRSFDNESVITLPKNRRISGSEFSDYETNYDAVSYTDLKDKSVRVVGDAEGEIMKLGAQPFLQYGLLDANLRRAQNIVNAIKRMRYTPFKTSALPAFIALDLGDVISMPDDYSEESSSGAVMQMSYTFNKAVSISCYGDNPALQSAQSKAEKNISGLINNTTQNEVTYYNYTNIEEIDILPEVETTIASLAFMSAQTTTVKILHEFLLDMVRDLTVEGGYELRYYLDNELIGYKPRESLSPVIINTQVPIVPPPPEGDPTEPVQGEIDPVEISITRDFFYIIRNVAPNFRHTWVVKILTHGIESAKIGIENAHVTLEGQRLFGEEHFDGQIEIKENFFKISLVGMGVKQLEESVTVNVPNAEIITVSENITLYDLGYIGINSLGEEISIVKTWLPLASETHLNFLTEDGLLIRVQD